MTIQTYFQLENIGIFGEIKFGSVFLPALLLCRLLCFWEGNGTNYTFLQSLFAPSTTFCNIVLLGFTMNVFNLVKYRNTNEYGTTLCMNDKQKLYRR